MALTLEQQQLLSPTAFQPAGGMQQVPARPRPAVVGSPSELPATPSPAAVNLAAGVNMAKDYASIPLDTIRAVGKTVAQVPRFATYPTLDAALNLGAKAFGGKREDPSYYTGVAYEGMAKEASGITKPIKEGYKNLSESVRNYYGLSPADQPATAKPAPAAPVAAKPAQTKAEQDRMLANPTINPALNQEPQMMARQAEEYTPAARNPVKDYLDQLSAESSANAAIRAQALQDLQDAQNVDTSSFGKMVVSAAKGRRKGMAASAVLKNVEAMDPNKFKSPVVQQGMQSEASKYTADTGAAASRYTAQSSAAESAKNRELKAQLEGGKAMTEAQTAKYIAQNGMEKYLSMVHPGGGEFGSLGMTQDNQPVTYSKTKGVTYIGGKQAEEERAQGSALYAQMAALPSNQKQQFENKLSASEKQAIQKHIDSLKAK